jgi:hypothetical protein
MRRARIELRWHDIPPAGTTLRRANDALHTLDPSDAQVLGSAEPLEWRGTSAQTLLDALAVLDAIGHPCAGRWTFYAPALDGDDEIDARLAAAPWHTSDPTRLAAMSASLKKKLNDVSRRFARWQPRPGRCVGPRGLRPTAHRWPPREGRRRRRGGRRAGAAAHRWAPREVTSP